MRPVLAFTCAMAMSWATPAWASQLVYDGFDYPAGQRVLGQTNPSTGTSYLFSGAAGAGGDSTAINVAGGSLASPAGLPAAVGNSAAITGVGNLSGTCNRLAFDSAGTQITTGTIYYSLLLRVDSLAGSNTATGGWFIGLNNTGNSTGGSPTMGAARLQGRIDPTDPTKYNLGIFNNRSTGIAASTSWLSTKFDPGETLFLVAAYAINPNAGDDLSSLWINPGDLGAQTAPAPSVTDTVAGLETFTGLASILLRQSPAPQATLDELRVGTTWAAVTPEPASLILMALGGLALRRRRGA